MIESNNNERSATMFAHYITINGATMRRIFSTLKQAEEDERQLRKELGYGYLSKITHVSNNAKPY